MRFTMSHFSSIAVKDVRAEELARAGITDSTTPGCPMRILCSLALRCALAVMALSFGLAVAIGMYVGDTRSARTRDDDQPVVANLGPTRSSNKTNWIDRNTGEMHTFTTGVHERHTFLSSSPWTEANGNRQVVGGWLRFNPRDPKECGWGLIRLEYPSGNVLDRIDLPAGFTAVRSVPVWDPQTDARVHYVSTDGQLCRISFDENRPEPEHVAWGVAPPHETYRFRGDPTWLSQPDHPPRLLVALSHLGTGKDEQLRLTPSRLWWLELDQSGRQIIAAGPVEFEKNAASGRARELACPTLHFNQDGSVQVAYLSRDDDSGWDVCVSQLLINPKNGEPSIAGPTAVVSHTLVETAPTFSSDGKHLLTTRADKPSNIELTRVDLDRKELASATHIGAR